MRDALVVDALSRALAGRADVAVADGVLVHEGARGAYGSWRSHALSDLDFDRAWYTRMRDGYLNTLAAGARR